MDKFITRIGSFCHIYQAYLRPKEITCDMLEIILPKIKYNKTPLIPFEMVYTTFTNLCAKELNFGTFLDVKAQNTLQKAADGFIRTYFEELITKAESGKEAIFDFNNYLTKWETAFSYDGKISKRISLEDSIKNIVGNTTFSKEAIFKINNILNCVYYAFIKQINMLLKFSEDKKVNLTIIVAATEFVFPDGLVDDVIEEAKDVVEDYIENDEETPSKILINQKQIDDLLTKNYKKQLMSKVCIYFGSVLQYIIKGIHEGTFELNVGKNYEKIITKEDIDGLLRTVHSYKDLY